MSLGKTKVRPEGRLSNPEAPGPAPTRTNSPPASTNIVKPSMRNWPIGSSGRLEPGASLMKLIRKARLLRDRFAFQRVVLSPTRSTSPTFLVLLSPSPIISSAFPRFPGRARTATCFNTRLPFRFEKPSEAPFVAAENLVCQVWRASLHGH